MEQDPKISDMTEVLCFVSHKCRTPEGKDHRHHAFIDLLSQVFQDFGMKVIKDPFGPGQDVGVRIETVQYHTFLFLSCEETWKSPPCQHEMKDAQRRGVPLFLIRWDGEVPKEHGNRMYVDCTANNGTNMDSVLQKLAAGIVVRGRLYRMTDAIATPGTAAGEQRQLAMAIYDNKDRTAVAEFLPCLDEVYQRIFDPMARYWIALAVGDTGDSRVKNILQRWLTVETHPLPRDGILEALRLRESD